MAEVRHTEVFNCTPEQFFNILVDYENYPKFLNEVQSCQVIEDQGKCKKVGYHISLIKDFRYINEHRETRPEEMSWIFLEGDLFREMSGYWKLMEKGNQTKAEYFIKASFSLFVPGIMTKTILSVNLPAIMKNYHQRIAEIYGGKDGK